MNHIPQNFKKQFEQMVYDVMTYSKAVGLAAGIVNKQGKVLYEGFFGYQNNEQKTPVNRNTVFGLASITKSFTTLAILQLIEKKCIKLHDPVSNYISSFTSSNRPYPVEIYHLLSHSGGYFPLPRILLDTVAAQLNIKESKDSDFAYLESLAKEGVKQVAERLDKQTNFIGKPGERFSYCNDGFALLCDIVRTQGDCNSYAEYLEKHILSPLRMDRSGCSFIKPAEDNNASILYTKNEDGTITGNRNYHTDAFVLHGGGGMKSTLSDMEKYICMYLNSGKTTSNTYIISAESIYEMEKPRQYAAPGVEYCFGLEQFQGDIFPIHGHGGSLPGVSSNFMWSDDREFGIVILCNTMDIPVEFLAKAAINICMGKKAVNPASVPIYSWNHEWLENISGTYTSGEGDSFTLSEEKDDFNNLEPAMTINGKSVCLHPISINKGVVVKKFGATYLEFLCNQKGKVWGAQYGSRVFPKDRVAE